MKNKLSRFAVPYVVWMAIFVVAPIVIMVIYAFSNGEGGATLSNFIQMGDYAAVCGFDRELAQGRKKDTPPVSFTRRQEKGGAE